jgi:hypothetical protein
LESQESRLTQQSRAFAQNKVEQACAARQDLNYFRQLPPGRVIELGPCGRASALHPMIAEFDFCARFRRNDPQERNEAGMKAFVKWVARSAGYEIRKVEKVESASCSNPVGVPPQDEIVPGPWQGHVLEMANRNHRPKVLQYHRSKFGDDQRLKYILNFLDLRDLRTLEPGPHEGYFSIIFEKLGVRENIAFESRLENLRKCQRIKEIYGLNRTTFLLGNLEDFYNGTKQPQFAGRFDLVLCLGVLYHVPDPGKALAWFRSQARTLFLGTHFPLPDLPSDAVYTYNGKSYRAGNGAKAASKPASRCRLRPNISSRSRFAKSEPAHHDPCGIVCSALSERTCSSSPTR